MNKLLITALAVVGVTFALAPRAMAGIFAHSSDSAKHTGLSPTLNISKEG